MKTIIDNDVINSLKPCADRYENYLKFYAEFSGTIEEFLFLPKITHQDKLWVSLRLLPRNLVEVFAIDCAVSAQDYVAAAYVTAAYVADDVADYAYAYAYAAAADAAYVAGAYDYAYAAGAYDYAYAADAYDYAYAAYAAAEKERQIEALIWLYNSEEE